LKFCLAEIDEVHLSPSHNQLAPHQTTSSK